MGKEVGRLVFEKEIQKPTKRSSLSLANEELLIKTPTTKREMIDVELKSWNLSIPITRHKFHS